MHACAFGFHTGQASALIIPVTPHEIQVCLFMHHVNQFQVSHSPKISQSSVQGHISAQKRRAHRSSSGRLYACLRSDNLPVHILKAPASKGGALGELLSELSGLQPEQIQQLIDLGAVYYGDPDCSLNPPKWRRANRLGTDALHAQISQVSPQGLFALVLHHNTAPSHAKLCVGMG